MAGLLGGPLCQVAETALESVCDKVLLGKIGLQAFKAVKNGVNSPKLSEEDKIRLKFETIGAHIEGACRILKPAMELKNILLPESRSADRTRPGEKFRKNYSAINLLIRFHKKYFDSFFRG